MQQGSIAIWGSKSLASQRTCHADACDCRRKWKQMQLSEYDVHDRIADEMYGQKVSRWVDWATWEDVAACAGDQPYKSDPTSATPTTLVVEFGYAATIVSQLWHGQSWSYGASAPLVYIVFRPSWPYPYESRCCQPASWPEAIHPNRKTTRCVAFILQQWL